MKYENHAACEEWAERVSALRDNELSGSEREATAAHLATCDHCRQLTSTMDSIDNLIRTPVDVDANRILTQSMLAGRPRVRGMRGYASNLATLGTAAALLLGFVGLVRWMQPGQDVGHVPERPLEMLRTISYQQRRTQEMAREALQWELRALKLELDQLQLTPDESRQLRDRLTELTRQLEVPEIENSAMKIGETT